MWRPIQHDFIVVGSGLAGLTISLLAAKHGHVALVTKDALGEGNSIRAQGGIAVALGNDDHPSLHKRDTLETGKGLCDERAVEVLVEEAPRAIQFLLDFKIAFDHDGNGNFSLGREGAHSRNRILHAGGDATGASIIQVLTEHVKNCANITVYTHTRVVDLLVHEEECLGVVGITQQGKPLCITGRATVLACGGLGHLYPYTTNGTGMDGEGYGLAYRAGALLRDMEFIQFHPTALNVGLTPQPLVSEAVRGEGAILLNNHGERFMENIDPRKELASRDIVARAICREMEEGRKVFLDVSTIHDFTKRFPTITSLCLLAGIDPTKQWIPVTPAVHYAMGGVVTDLHGRTTVQRLLAVGEISSTGVHGANRLASNSLLEALVFSLRAAEMLPQYLTDCPSILPTYSELELLDANRHFDRDIHIELQQRMWKHAGIIREEQGLLQSKGWIERRISDLENVPIPLLNILTTARLVVEGALWRKESRGAHARSDYPAMDPAYQKHFLQGGKDESDPARSAIATSTH
jgi:L-aspartate oxidase